MSSATVAVMRPSNGPVTPVPVLFLVADYGGGHRAAARAVGQALEDSYPGSFTPVVCDPLGGPRSVRLVRWIASVYGPLTRRAPWLWGVIYYASDFGPVMRLVGRSLLGLAVRPVADAVADHRPAAIVSFHPLTGRAAVEARRREARDVPVVTVITDLVTAHTAWRYDKVDRVVAPSASVRRRCHLDGIAADRCVEIGLPVCADFRSRPADHVARSALRRSLGVAEQKFVVVLMGGAEGSGGIGKRAAALARRFDDVAVVAISGRNRRLQRRLGGVAARARGQLIVKGFVDNVSDWMRCADVVVTKAGPGTIAEATSCGAPLVLTSHLPGQEKGNTELVVDAGAGRRVRSVQRLVHEIDRLRQDPTAVDAMRAASARLGRPYAATGVADLLAELVGEVPAAGPAGAVVGADGPREVRR